MRPQTAHNIVSRAFTYYLQDGKYHHFFTKRVRKALIKCHSHYHELSQKKTNAIVERMDMFGIPHSSNSYKRIENLWNLVNSFGEKLTDKTDPYYTLPVTRLSYLSDRWNAPNRIAFILWVIENFSPDELSDIHKFNESPDVEIRKRYPIHQPDDYEEPTYVDLCSLTETEFKKLSYFKKVKGFGKAWMGVNKHIREYSLVFLDADDRTVTEMHHPLYISNKWVYHISATTRFQPKFI